MNKDKQVSDKNSVLEIVALSCGGLNLIYSGFVIYLIIKRVLFLLANKDFISVYDYLYIAIAATYLVINLIGVIMVVLKYFLIPVSDKSNSILKVIFNIIFIIGIALLGITILGLIGVVISLPKSEYIDYIKFLLFQVIIFEAVGLVLFCGTFIPMFLTFNTSDEEEARAYPNLPQMYEMVKLNTGKI